MIEYIDDDFVAVRSAPDSDAPRRVTAAFGDPVEVLEERNGFTRVRLPTVFDGQFEGWVKGDPPRRARGVMQLSMVDVQQGDGLVLETPPAEGELHGKIVFVDGGDNPLFARHVSARYRHLAPSPDAPLEVDALLITHGDADHFDGLNDLRRSETLGRCRQSRRIPVHPRRIFHNGLVKGPAERAGKAVPNLERFGRTVEVDGRHFVVDLFDDTRQAAPENTGQSFRFWHDTLAHWQPRGAIDLRRVDASMDPADLFDFLAEDGVAIELLGPVVRQVPDPDGGGQVPGLPFLRRPKKRAEMHLERGSRGKGSASASHTINGHSITFRLTFGDLRMLFTGDLNQEAMAAMLERVGPEALQAEILKTPHHGSADFDLEMLRAVSPVVSLVSSGDESGFKEHIHPKATLLGALGKCSRGDTGLVLCTELAAFFAIKKYCHSREALADYFRERADQQFTGQQLLEMFRGTQPCRGDDMPDFFYGFERTNFGITHLRTDGHRVLIFTHSGKKFLNEAYRFEVRDDGAEHAVTFADEVTTR